MYVDLNNSIVNFSNSILKHFGVDTFHNSIKEVDEVLKGHSKVVVCLFDGFGDYILKEHSKYCKFINNHIFHQMTATFPPTTVASTNGFMSARFPAETGWMAWSQYFEEYDANIDVFTNRNENTGEFLEDPKNNICDRYCHYESIFELINNKGKANAHKIQCAPINPNGPKTLRTSIKMLNDVLRKEKDCFIYFYWQEPDQSLHEFGIHDKHASKQIKKIDKFMKKVTKENPDTLFLSIADHGLIDVVQTDICIHDDLYSLLRRKVSFEGRSLNFFVKENKLEEFKSLFLKYYGKSYDIYSKKEVDELQIYGDGPRHYMYDKFVGDFIAIAKDNSYLFASKDYTKQRKILIGHHAGGTKEELLINIGVYNQ